MDINNYFILLFGWYSVRDYWTDFFIVYFFFTIYFCFAIYFSSSIHLSLIYNFSFSIHFSLIYNFRYHFWSNGTGPLCFMSGLFIIIYLRRDTIYLFLYPGSNRRNFCFLIIF